MFTFTHASFPAKYSESTQQIKMAKMAVAKDSDRGLTWTHDETRALIQIWADSEIQKDFETCRRNASIYEKLATRLRDSGFGRIKINSGFSKTGFVFFGNLYFFSFNGEFQMCLNRQVDSIRITLQRRNLHRIENGLVRFSVNRVLDCWYSTRWF